jgi:hypothetical protein
MNWVLRFLGMIAPVTTLRLIKNKARVDRFNARLQSPRCLRGQQGIIIRSHPDHRTDEAHERLRGSPGDRMDE